MNLRFGGYIKVLLMLTTWLLNSCAATSNQPNTAKSPTNSPSSKEERISEVKNSIFCLSVIAPNSEFPRKRAIGTGFLVSKNLLATAFHVKEDLEKATVNFASLNAKIIAWAKFDNGLYLEIPLTPLESDKESDLALFGFDEEILRRQAQTNEIKPLIIADRLPNIGEDILSVGYYGTLELPFNSMGNVSMIDNNEDIYSDITLMPGNSGSPLISLKTGEVLGLNIKVMTVGDGTIRLGISKRISKLKMLLEKIDKN